MARTNEDSKVKTVLMILVAGFVIYSMVALSGTQKKGISGEAIVLASDEQTYKISLETEEVVPIQDMIVEQYGRWWIEDSAGEILSRGTELELSGGQFNAEITISIPKEKQVTFIADIIEYKSALVGNNYVKDTGTIKTQDYIELSVPSCSQHADCSVDSLCLGKFGYCSDNLCEAKGECKTCSIDSDCGEEDGVEYMCSDSVCMPKGNKDVFESIKKSFETPLTEVGPVPEGEEPTTKLADPIFQYVVFITIGIVGVLIYKRRKG